MRLVKRLARSGVFFVLFYMFLYSSARMASLFGQSFLSWAAFQGTRLLDLPGTVLFVRRYGEGELYNASRNLLLGYKMGVAIPVFLVAGVAFGFFLGPLQAILRLHPAGGPELPKAHPSGAEEVAAAGQRSDLAIASFILSVAGIFCLGSLLGFLALLFGAIASHRICARPFLKGKGLAILGQIIGAVDIVVWTLALTVEAP